MSESILRMILFIGCILNYYGVSFFIGNRLNMVGIGLDKWVLRVEYWKIC